MNYAPVLKITLYFKFSSTECTAPFLRRLLGLDMLQEPPNLNLLYSFISST